MLCFFHRFYEAPTKARHWIFGFIDFMFPKGNIPFIKPYLSPKIYKTLGKKITSLDVLNGCKISSLNFSDDDGYVVVNYVKGNGTRFKVYQSGGSIVSLELDDIFAEEEYNLIYERIQDNNIIMNVTPIIKSNNTESGLIGRYKISLKDFKLEKL